MIKKYLTLILLALAGSSFGMKRTFEQKPKQEQLLEQLRKEAISFLSILPTELIGEIESRRKYDQILYTIETSNTLDEALDHLNKLANQPNFALYFNDPWLTDGFIYTLVNKFDNVSGFIARQLQTVGSKRWFEEIRPVQKEFFKAVKRGDIEKTKKLLDQRVNINTQDISQSTALIIAAEKGHIDIVRYLIDRGADINAQNTFGDTALTKAATKSHLEIVKLLLEHGTDLRIKNNCKETALDIAQREGNQEIIKLLPEAVISDTIELVD